MGITVKNTGDAIATSGGYANSGIDLGSPATAQVREVLFLAVLDDTEMWAIRDGETVTFSIETAGKEQRITLSADDVKRLRKALK